MPTLSHSNTIPPSLHVRTAAAAVTPLSGDDSIQYILADIPFFAVGLLAVGVFTFFLVMRRVNRMVLSLHLSAFLAFIAAIFDLSQNLVRGRVATNLGQDLNSVMGLIIVREIGFSFSVGLRFFFFWFFVAQPPSGEQDIPGDMHSGSWGRWGGLGMVLKWGMAMVCVVIPILQILDRIVTPLHKFSGVYEVEGTMEIVASAVFILKLGLNTYLAVLSTPKGEPKWKSLQGYVAVILALVLSAAIGVGNVALFQFSETVLGRFLQGVMLYILLVFILIHTFFDFRPDFPLDASGLRLNRSSSFQGLPPVNQRDSFFRITPPMASLESVGRFSRRPSNFSRISSSHKSQKDKPSRSSPPTSRRANPSRLSALLVPRRSSGRFAPPQSPDDVDRLWNQDEAEKGMSPHVTFDSQEVDIPPPRSSSELSPPGPKESARWQDPVFTSVLREASGDVPQSVSPRSSFPLPTLAIPPRALSRAEMPVAGYSESPIYGLHGVVRGQMSPSAFPSPPVMQSLRRDGSDSPSEGTRSSISYLLRQQAELDKSIANLRLLTQSESLTATRRGSETSSESKIPSAAQSEFSLSNFPEPPWGLSRVEAEITRRTGGFPTVAALRQAATLRTANNEPPAPAPSEPLPPPPPIGGAEHSRTLSLPYSDNGESSIMGRDRSKFDSQGTQFEITSFIGDLSHPEHKPEPSTSQDSTFNESSGDPRDLKVANRPDLKPAPLIPSRSITTLPEKSRIGPGAGRGMFPTAGTIPLQHRSVVGLPPRPRLTSAAMLSPLAERSAPSGEYERPRPAPLPRGPST